MYPNENEELKLFRDMVQRFIAEQIAPYYEQWEKDGIIPKSVWQQMGKTGLLCCDIPEQYGGIGADFSFNALVVEELAAAGFFALSCNLLVHADITAHYILNNGTEAQKQKYLPGMVSGDCIGAIAMTEPGAGSDLQGMKTRAVKDGEHWVINGSKTFISNGQNAAFVLTAARTNDDPRGAKGTSLFLVDSNKNGVTKGNNLEKIGQHSGDTSEIFYSDVRVTEEDLLGGLNQGFPVLMNELPRERLILACAATAHTEGAVKLTIDYVKERRAFGKPLAELQDIRFKLADASTQTELHRVLIEHYKQLLADKALSTVQASKAKYSATEMECSVIDTCLQMFGGYGYMSEYPISRFYCDARVQRIYGGTSEIMKVIISQDLLGR